MKASGISEAIVHIGVVQCRDIDLTVMMDRAGVKFLCGFTIFPIVRRFRGGAGIANPAHCIIRLIHAVEHGVGLVIMSGDIDFTAGIRTHR